MLSAVNISTSFIIRLEDRYHSNFSIKTTYFTGTISKTLYNVSRKDCALSCTVHAACWFCNHKDDNSICNLINSTNGKFENRIGWKFLTTDYTDSKNVSKLDDHFNLVTNLVPNPSDSGAEV